MNADQLLACYDRFGDAPHEISNLRRFILDLAVRGKLSRQDPREEPASDLLGRAANERARLGKSGRVVSAEGGSTAPVAPFALPSGWAWARLHDVLTKLTDGTHHSPPNGPVGEFKYITAKNIKNSGVSLEEITYVSRAVHDEIYSRCNPEKGDILYIKDGATTGVAAINDLSEPFSMLSSVALLKLSSCIVNRLILFFLRAPFFYDQVRGQMKGAAITRVTLKRMAPSLLPIPPLPEQHRIVAKVDELMALCDRLEAARVNREATRNRFTAAALGRLYALDPDTFREDARFAIDAVPALTARADQVKQLRQTILNLAMRGRLVRQDPNDEPASELLKRIRREFAKLVESGALNKPKPLKHIAESDQLFSLPTGWVLARFNQIASIQSKLVDPKRYKSMPHIAPDNIESWTARLLPYGSIEEAGVFSGKHLFSAGAILYSKIRPNLAKVTKVDFDGLCSADMYPIHALVDREFLVKFMITRDFVSQAVNEENRVAMPKINQAALSDILVPVPPLAEQRRIVVKLDELMALCDRLEAKLAAAAETRGRLLEALFAEALAAEQEPILDVAV